MSYSRLFLVPIRISSFVDPHTGQEKAGGLVLCFASAKDHLTATKRAVEQLVKDQFEVVEMAGDVQEIPVQEWSKYLTSVWPEFVTRFPSESIVKQHVLSETVFYGPFLTFDES